MPAVARPGVPTRPPALASAEWLRAHPLSQRAQAWIPRPELVLATAITAWFVFFTVLVTWRHDRFASFDFDLGVWDQLTWLYAHGGSFSTVRGLPSFGFHATPAMYLYVPFYWLGAGPNLLNQSMVAAVCLSAWPVYRAARHHLRDEWYALVPALAFLVNFSAQWLLQETFHPEVMAIPFLLLAYLATIEGRWRAYAVWIGIAVLWKEDIALAATMVGVVLAVRGTWGSWRGGDDRQARHTRAAGLATMAGAGGYFLFATQWWLPHFSSAGNFTEVGWFGDLGNSSLEILRSMLTRPDLVSAHLSRSDPFQYFTQLGGSFGFVALLSPLPLLIGLPQATINLLTVQNFFWPTTVHYAVVPLVAITIASVEGLARPRRLALRRLLLTAMAVAAAVTALSSGAAPFVKDYEPGTWPLEQPANGDRLERALARPGPDDAVSASYYLVPHLTHRFEIYTFPNPWYANNWGVEGENRPDPGTVDWIIVNPAELPPNERSSLVSALTQPDHLLDPGAAPAPALPAEQLGAVADPRHWTVVTDDPDLLVVRRVR